MRGSAIAQTAGRHFVLELGHRAPYIGFGSDQTVHGLGIKRHLATRLQSESTNALHRKLEGVAAVAFFGELAVRCARVIQTTQHPGRIPRIRSLKALIHRNGRRLKVRRRLGACLHTDRP